MIATSTALRSNIQARRAVNMTWSAICLSRSLNFIKRTSGALYLAFSFIVKSSSVTSNTIITILTQLTIVRTLKAFILFVISSPRTLF